MNLDIALIRTDGNTQPRQGLSEAAIRDYALDMMSGDQFPPIVVFFDGESYWLSAGFHRLAAAQQTGATTIDADVREGGPREAWLYAVEDNRNHGVRYTNEDKRVMIDRFLEDEEWRKWSNSEIARRCGVDHKTVAARRSPGKFPGDIRTYVDKHGNVSTMNIANMRGPDKVPPPPPTLLDMTDAPEQDGHGLSQEEWDDEPDEIIADCIKTCYGRRVMVKGSVYEYGVRGVYVCTGCDYAYPPGAGLVEEEESEGEQGVPEENGRNQHVMRVMGSSASPEWYTPSYIIDYVLKLFGVIHVDPCSNSREQPNVPAQTGYTKDDDGLTQPWFGNVYMNPPYGDEISAWTSRLVALYRDGHIAQAIALIPGRIDTAWFQPLYAFPMCNVRGRIRFQNADNSAPFPSVIVYLGTHESEFIEVFKELGPIVKRIA